MENVKLAHDIKKYNNNRKALEKDLIDAIRSDGSVDFFVYRMAKRHAKSEKEFEEMTKSYESAKRRLYKKGDEPYLSEVVDLVYNVLNGKKYKPVKESPLKEENMNNVIWSTNGTRDYITGLGDEEKFNALVDRGYDPEMLGNAENIDDIVARDDYMWQDDAEDFEQRIVPMLNAQTKNGIVVMCNGEECKAVNAEDLVGGDIDPNIDSIEIVDDGDGLVWVGNGINGEKKYELRAIPEDIDLSVFLPEFEGEDFSLEDVREYGDLDSTAQMLPKLKNGLSEGCHKENLEEAKTNDRQELANELEEIKPLADEYGFSYFTSMPFTAFEGDPESVEAQFPEFFKVCKAFFKEMGIANDPNNVDELEELWYENIDQHDFDTIVKTCELMIKHENGSQQIEKVYKDGYATLDDNEILASRKPQDEVEEESLEEAKCVRCDKDEKHLNKDGLCDECEDELTEAKCLGACDSKKQEKEREDKEAQQAYKEKPSKFDIKADEGVNMDKLRAKLMNEDTITDEDELNFDDPEDQSTEDLAKELADAYKSEFDGTPEAEQAIYDDIVKHFEDPDYAELVIEILKNDFYEEEPGMEEGLEKDLQDRYARAAEKYRKYAGYSKNEELEEDLSEPAMHRVCYEENLSMEELKGALGR